MKIPYAAEFLKIIGSNISDREVYLDRITVTLCRLLGD